MPEKEEHKKGLLKNLVAQIGLTRRKAGRTVHDLLDGSFLTRERFMRLMPFIIFLLILAVIYITNIFHVERTKRQIDDLEEQLRELRYEYISSRSKLMYESKPSEIATKLKDTGIEESLDPPKKIKVITENKPAKP